jgi:hypothetical protein
LICVAGEAPRQLAAGDEAAHRRLLPSRSPVLSKTVSTSARLLRNLKLSHYEHPARSLRIVLPDLDFRIRKTR